MIILYNILIILGFKSIIFYRPSIIKNEMRKEENDSAHAVIW